MIKLPERKLDGLIGVYLVATNSIYLSFLGDKNNVTK